MKLITVMLTLTLAVVASADMAAGIASSAEAAPSASPDSQIDTAFGTEIVIDAIPMPAQKDIDVAISQLKSGRVEDCLETMHRYGITPIQASFESITQFVPAIMMYESATTQLRKQSDGKKLKHLIRQKDLAALTAFISDRQKMADREHVALYCWQQCLDMLKSTSDSSMPQAIPPPGKIAQE